MPKTANKKIKIILGIFLISTILLSPFGAKAKSDDEVFQEIEKLKDSPLFYSQNVSDMQELQGFIASNIYELEKITTKGQEEIKADSKKTAELKDLLKSKERTRRVVLRKIYIDGVMGKGIFALLNFDNFMDFITQGVYGKKAFGSTNEQIKKIDDEKLQIEKSISASEMKDKVLKNQIAFLKIQLENVKNSIKIASTESAREDSFSENSVLDTSKVVTPINNRDFISWNKVDFTTQDSIKFTGAGTAHGVGMSQYGAKAMAENGSDFQAILGHYYQGTVVGKIDTENLIVRVKLSTNGGGTITARGGSATAVKVGSEKIQLSVGDSINTEEGLKVVPTTSNTILELNYKGDVFNKYRGVIETKILPGEGFSTINYIYLEDYLKGVVPGEMSASWALEALKAQAVAARNYVYKSISPTKQYDICDTPACQVYLGASHEQNSSNQAVDDTRGMGIYYNNEIITAYFFSSSGGWTEDNENVWGGTPRLYLRGVPSPGEKSPYNQWVTDTISKASVQSYLNNNDKTAVGELKNIEIIKRGVSGRVMAVKVIGSQGEKIVTGYTFKTIINLGLPDGESNYIKDVLFGIR